MIRKRVRIIRLVNFININEAMYVPAFELYSACARALRAMILLCDVLIRQKIGHGFIHF